MWLLIHAGIKVMPHWQKGTQMYQIEAAFNDSKCEGCNVYQTLNSKTTYLTLTDLTLTHGLHTWDIYKHIGIGK